MEPEGWGWAGQSFPIRSTTSLPSSLCPSAEQRSACGFCSLYGSTLGTAGFVSPQFFCPAAPQGASRDSFSRGHCCWVKAHGLVAGEMSQRVTTLLFKCRNKSFDPQNQLKVTWLHAPSPHIADEMEQEAVGSLETRLLSITDWRRSPALTWVLYWHILVHVPTAECAPPCM